MCVLCFVNILVWKYPQGVENDSFCIDDSSTRTIIKTHIVHDVGKFNTYRSINIMYSTVNPNSGFSQI